jgi:hypothetical protein
VSSWDELEALANAEALVVAEGRIEELAELYDKRAALIAALPRPLPPAAVGPLKRALATQWATATALSARRDAVGAELGRLDRGRAGVRGYARTFDVAP